MENKKILILLYILFITLISCNNQNKKSNEVAVGEPDSSLVVCQKDTLLIKENLVLEHIEDFFQQEGVKRDIEFLLVSQDTVNPRDTLNWKKMSHINGLKERINKRFIFNTKSESIIVLSSLLYDSDECSKQHIHNLKINADSIIKIPYFAFRIDSHVYTIFVTSNIEHIRANVYRNCKAFFELNLDDCYP